MNDWCKSKHCEHYIEWSYYVDDDVGDVPCVSCKLQGQSHRIEDIPKNCPHRESDITAQLLEVAKEINKE